MANAPGDASVVTIAEPNRADVPSRWHALRNTDASPLRGAYSVRSWANNPGDASVVTIAEPNRAGVPSRMRFETRMHRPYGVHVACIFSYAVRWTTGRMTPVHPT